MFKSTLPAITLFCAAWVCVPASAVTLYDPALGTLPDVQGWTPLTVGTGATQNIVAGRLRIDTISDVNALMLVHGLVSPVVLDTAVGFTLNFGLQVLAETHQSDNRAGYSVLVQGEDPTKGIELEFWQDRVWALDFVLGGADSGYVHGIDGPLDTMASFRNYALTVQNHQYSLRADGNLVLQGALVDYPVQGLSTAVYGSSSTVFFGDNSTRGQSRVDLGLVSVTAVPELQTVWMWLAGAGLLAWRRATRTSRAL